MPGTLQNIWHCFKCPSSITFTQKTNGSRTTPSQVTIPQYSASFILFHSCQNTKTGLASSFSFAKLRDHGQVLFPFSKPRFSHLLMATPWGLSHPEQMSSTSYTWATTSFLLKICHMSFFFKPLFQVPMPQFRILIFPKCQSQCTVLILNINTYQSYVSDH